MNEQGTDLVLALRDYNRQDTDELMDRAAAEIDCLRHDIERMQEIDSEHLAEIDRLRAEVAILKGINDDLQQRVLENDRLRAENAELREALIAAIERLQMQGHWQPFIGKARAILAKTAKE